MSPAQILLVSGFLGAGKTTLINRLLHEPGARRIAAVVNDFGDVNIDAALLSESADEGVLSLKNGCICCTLQRDLLRTLSNIMNRQQRPDTIVIETSGISNLRDIVGNLLDPVIFKFAALDTVVTLVDAAAIADSDELPGDRTWVAQVKASDFLLFSKGDLIDQTRFEQVCQRVRAAYPGKHLFDMRDASPGLLFGHALHESTENAGQIRVNFPIDFETATWRCEQPLELAGFQALLAELSSFLLRAKGFIEFVEIPEKPMFFQLVGARATVVASPVEPSFGNMTSLVLIARRDSGGIGKALAILNRLAGRSSIANSEKL